jgi:2-polyprenyl-3-methyl-5-hydroxy-6-metoxy-1,4-benzoquinol methylase
MSDECLFVEVDLGSIGRQVIVPDRVAPTVELAEGKRVLNVGCCGSDVLARQDSVHSRIADASSYCVGVDVYEDGVRKLQRDGYNVLVADAQSFDLREQFDIAILGDVIEHLANPGCAFDMVNRHLVDGGLLAVSTPHPFALPRMIKMMFCRPLSLNREHVAWFDPVVMSYLLERSGFEVQSVFWTDPSRVAPLRWVQSRRMQLHATFGVVARKVEDCVGP